MPIWADLFKLFAYSDEKDPLSKKKNPKQFPSAGIGSPEALNLDGGQGGQVNYRESNDMIDTTTLSNRAGRYKEYERLRSVPEIEMAMTVFADESCVAGHTKIATPFGYITIKELAEKRSDERFLVYCYDFKQKDYTLGWAYAPRLVKRAETVNILLDNGGMETVTHDHLVCKKDGTWIQAGQLQYGDELMPFYRMSVSHQYNRMKRKQYPRIFTFNKGWIHERQFLDDWKSGTTAPQYERLNRMSKMFAAGLTIKKVSEMFNCEEKTVELRFNKEGFTIREMKILNKFNAKHRRVVGIEPGITQDVYDLSVDTHKCFATENLILHNCQKDEDGNIFKIETGNDKVKEELQFLMYHRKMLNLNRTGWKWFKNLCMFGDWFIELVVNPDNPKEGIYQTIPLPPETMYRIETIKGKVVEFQQSKDGPDYQAIQKTLTGNVTDREFTQTTAIRFPPSQIVHFRIGDDRKSFYPYGQSLIEPARAPAHSLRLMEDAMVVYRLTRAPERRVFYIDVGQLAPFKAESYIERLKDQFRKRKIATGKGAGANQVDEKWQPPAQDEDYWLPIRPSSNTRIETLPGAENLGEIDDAIYFRNKLLTALNFPKSYMNNEDPGATRITLSAQDVKFARMIERLQSHFEDGLMEIAERHLQLMGFPEQSYQDLKIKMTPPSDWRELSRAEVVTARYGNAGTLKSSQLMSDYDIMIDILKFNKDDVDEKLARLKVQKLEDLKLQVLAQNPQLMGIGIPGADPHAGQEMGTEPGGPNPMPGPEAALPGAPPADGQQPPAPPLQASAAQDTKPLDQNVPPEGINIADPEEEEIKKFDLEIQDYESEIDNTEIDHSIGD